MDTVVDGIIFELNPFGGVARLYRELLPRLCRLDETLNVHLLTNRACGYDIPAHPHLHERRLFPPVDRWLRPRRLFWPVIPPLAHSAKRRATRHLQNAIWHPTYYSLLDGWRGPRVITVYDMIYERFPDQFSSGPDRQFRAVKRAAAAAADAVICISQTTADDLQHALKIDAGKIHVIPLAPSASFTLLPDDQSPPPAGHPYLLYVGARQHYKNFDQVVEAYSRWHGRHQVELWVVGRAWSARERQRLADLKLIDRVRRLDPVSDEQLGRLYHQAAAFIYPSLYEGFGIPLLEASACGCPVIASRIPSSLEVAGDVPIYFDPARLDSLIAAFDQATAEARTGAPLERRLALARRYSWDKTAAQTLAVYQRLLSGQPDAS